ncbi:MAG: hypothetical protein MZV65_45180 [Chromatiales bacterium]|nr:hypothetical protein [Chromatiales bacterium]
MKACRQAFFVPLIQYPFGVSAFDHCPVFLNFRGNELKSLVFHSGIRSWPVHGRPFYADRHFGSAVHLYHAWLIMFFMSGQQNEFRLLFPRRMSNMMAGSEPLVIRQSIPSFRQILAAEILVTIPPVLNDDPAPDASCSSFGRNFKNRMNDLRRFFSTRIGRVQTVNIR